MALGPQCELLTLQPLGLQHLALLQGARWQPLRPRLQQLLLQRWPQRLNHLINRAASPPPVALVALHPSGGLAGLLVAEPCNRRGTCWRIDELLLEEELQSRTDTTILLIREVIQRVPGALSWIARAGSSDTPVLAALREQGFQTLQQQQVWRLNSAEQLQACPQMPGQLKLEELNSTNSALLLQLELSATPSLLRQMQDLRREDLLDDARSGSLLLVDSQRHQAVAAARLLRRSNSDGLEVELSLHPAWSQLMGPPLAELLRQSCQTQWPISLRCEVRNQAGMAWLESQGAEALHEELVLARSLWRRQESPAVSELASRTLERLVGQLQPGRPVPGAMPWR